MSCIDQDNKQTKNSEKKVIISFNETSTKIENEKNEIYALFNNVEEKNISTIKKQSKTKRSNPIIKTRKTFIKPNKDEESKDRPFDIFVHPEKVEKFLFLHF